MSALSGLIDLFSWNRSNTAPGRRFRETMSGLEFEEFCCAKLREYGWSADMTATHDQGIDVVARKRGTSVVLQCKKTGSGSVGIAAVQQIYAGKQVKRADHAAVVTNSAYSSSAKLVARECGVHLLHHSELRQLESALARRHQKPSESRPTAGRLRSSNTLLKIAVIAPALFGFGFYVPGDDNLLPSNFPVFAPPYGNVYLLANCVTPQLAERLIEISLSDARRENLRREPRCAPYSVSKSLLIDVSAFARST